MAGTDAPSVWPFAIYHFHGPQTAREIELVSQEAIAAATIDPARMLGLKRESGSVEVGKGREGRPSERSPRAARSPLDRPGRGRENTR